MFHFSEAESQQDRMALTTRIPAFLFSIPVTIPLRCIFTNRGRLFLHIFLMLFTCRVTPADGIQSVGRPPASIFLPRLALSADPEASRSSNFSGVHSGAGT